MFGFGGLAGCGFFERFFDFLELFLVACRRASTCGVSSGSTSGSTAGATLGGDAAAEIGLGIVQRRRCAQFIDVLVFRGYARDCIGRNGFDKDGFFEGVEVACQVDLKRPLVSIWFDSDRAPLDWADGSGSSVVGSTSSSVFLAVGSGECAGIDGSSGERFAPNKIDVGAGAAWRLLPHALRIAASAASNDAVRRGGGDAPAWVATTRSASGC